MTRLPAALPDAADADIGGPGGGAGQRGSGGKGRGSGQGLQALAAVSGVFQRQRGQAVVVRRCGPGCEPLSGAPLTADSR
jgi:hypothetical protein